MKSKQMKCILCCRLFTVEEHDPAYAKSQQNPDYKYVCLVCGGQAGREASQVTGLSPEMVDAMDKFISRKI